MTILTMTGGSIKDFARLMYLKGTVMEKRRKEKEEGRDEEETETERKRDIPLIG